MRHEQIGRFVRAERGEGMTMKRSSDDHEHMAALAVLAAAAREAEELLANERDLERGAIDEANRRLQQFMRAVRHVKR